MNDPRQPLNPGVPPVHPPIPRPSVNGPQPVRPASGQPPIQPMRTAPVAPAPKPVIDEPIALEDDLVEVVDVPARASSKIKFGPDISHKKHEWKRKPVVTGNGACRVKSFHGKYSDQGIEHLDDMINEWLDDHPEVEVKFVTQTVHVFEGKIREPALILNIWY